MGIGSDYVRTHLGDRLSTAPTASDRPWRELLLSAQTSDQDPETRLMEAARCWLALDRADGDLPNRSELIRLQTVCCGLLSTLAPTYTGAYDDLERSLGLDTRTRVPPAVEVGTALRDGLRDATESDAVAIVAAIASTALLVRGPYSAASLSVLDGWFALDLEGATSDAVRVERLRNGAHDARVQMTVLRTLVYDLIFAGRIGDACTVGDAWLGLDLSDFADSTLVARALNFRRGSVDPGNELWLLFLAVYGDAIRITPGRGSRQAVVLFEAWTGLDTEDFADPEKLSAALSCCERLQDVGAVARLAAWRTWAAGLRLVDGRSSVHSSRLLENGLGLSAAVYSDLDSLAAKLESAFTEVPLPQRFFVIENLAVALVAVPERGYTAVRALLESFLHISGEDLPPDRSAIEGALTTSLIGRVPEDLRANIEFAMVPTLADAWRNAGPGPTHASLLLESWLGIDGGDYADRARLRASLQRSVLARAAVESMAHTIVETLARARRDEGAPRQAYELVMAWAGDIDRPDNPVAVANFASMLALSATELDREARAAVTDLLERWCPSIRSWPRDPGFADAPVTTKSEFATAWLRVAGLGHPDLLAVADGLLDAYAMARLSVSQTAEGRGRILATLRRGLIKQREVLAGRVDDAWSAGKSALAVDLELILLSLGEQVENRTLLESRLDLIDEPGISTADIDLSASTAPRKPELIPSDIRPPVPLGVARPLLSGFDTGPVTRPMTSDTGILPDPGSGRGTTRSPELAAVLTARVELADLLPDGAVWLRILDRADGRLQWWAVRRNTGEPGVAVIARGSSMSDAVDRVADAISAAELDIERIWCRHLHLTGASGRAVPVSAHTAAVLLDTGGRSLTGDDLDEIAEELRTEPLRRRSLLRAVATADRGPSLESALQRAVVELVEPREPTTPDEAERMRRADLDAATDRVVTVIDSELELGGLAAATEVRWADVDLLLQPGSSLLGAPLAFLPVGGSPLMTAMRSITTTVSLTLSHWMGTAGANTTGLRALVATYSGHDGIAHGGLTDLHETVDDLSQSQGWQAWHLDDRQPVTTTASLGAALARHGPFPLVVVGGHGAWPAGVVLGDGVWAGSGIDLSAVELLALAVCAAGSMSQSRFDDVQGFYAAIAAHGGNAVLAPRWTVADIETAAVLDAMLREYIDDDRTHRFARARALARARRALLSGTSSRASAHVVAAFDLYGSG